MERVNEELIEYVKSKILTFSGINLAQSQYDSLIKHLEKNASKRKLSPMEFCKSLSPNTPDFDSIINLVTVNETYFFREEKQFDFLKEEVFPKYIGRSLTIWSASCSTGEEVLSLLALALSMNINITIYASDIDDNALKTLSKGIYPQYSLRPDGKKYHSLLQPYSKITPTEITFKKDFINRIHSFKFNLIQGQISSLPFYENVDIIFMRNVFIYFDKETRKLVCSKVTQRLKNDGLLFFSMNEIGSIDNSIIPNYLCKLNKGCVYYFVKGISKDKSNSKGRSIEERLEEKKNQIKNKKLKEEVEKVKLHKYIEEKDLSRAANNSNPSNSGDFDAKKTYESICQEINRGNFDKAREIVTSINGSQYKKYSFFMQGYIEYHADNRGDAETLFSSAVSISPDFWPAIFYHGIVLRDMGKNQKALECFSKCKDIISSYPSNLPYDFALDSFSPSYIYSLCETFSNLGGH
ncbi:MAG: hypothetical protein K5866_00335 [Treponema sp.]|nr:hypothetical protein [Treponema sp.]